MIVLGIGSLGINLPILIAQLVNFTILLVILRKFLFGPIVRMVDERRRRIEEGLNASQAMLLVASFLAGACVLGVQSGINVCGALVYPTSLRALGSGWELGIGRLGSIVGPLVGALFVRMPVDRLYIWSAAPFLLGAVICYTVHRLNQQRIRSRPWLAPQVQVTR